MATGCSPISRRATSIATRPKAPAGPFARCRSLRRASQLPVQITCAGLSRRRDEIASGHAEACNAFGKGKDGRPRRGRMPRPPGGMPGQARHATETVKRRTCSAQRRRMGPSLRSGRGGAPTRAGTSAGRSGGAGGSKPSSQPPSTSFQPDLGRGVAGFAWGIRSSIVSGISMAQPLPPAGCSRTGQCPWQGARDPRRVRVSRKKGGRPRGTRDRPGEGQAPLFQEAHPSNTNG
jgi:hypothetical protein